MDEIPDNLTPEQQDLLNELHARFTFCRLCIKTVSETPLDDPRREPAIAEYNQQLQIISQRIAAITGKPPNITIGLKPAILFPQGKGVNT